MEFKMQIELLRLNNHLSKGPLVEKFEDGKTIRLDQNVPKNVEEKYGWILLEKYPKLIRKITRKIGKPDSPEKSVKGVTKNKMVSKYRDKVDAIKRECASN
jgi:hypothetical protein